MSVVVWVCVCWCGCVCGCVFLENGCVFICVSLFMCARVGYVSLGSVCCQWRESSMRTEQCNVISFGMELSILSTVPTSPISTKRPTQTASTSAITRRGSNQASRESRAESSSVGAKETIRRYLSYWVVILVIVCDYTHLRFRNLVVTSIDWNNLIVLLHRGHRSYYAFKWPSNVGLLPDAHIS